MNIAYVLGGFAEEPEDIDIDVTKEEFYNFNLYLARAYFDAMRSEDFKVIGEMSSDLIYNIIHWLNYDGIINKDIEKEVKKIETGLFLTCKNRTFIDAIVENKNVSFAETYINLGIKDARLYVLCMLYDDCYKENTIINKINYFVSSKEEYISFLKSVFDEIEYKYNNLESKKEKLSFFNILKNNIRLIRYNIEYGKINVKEIGNYNWIKELKLIF